MDLLHTSGRDHIVKLIRRWGSSTTDALLDPSCQFFKTQDIQGLIGYHALAGCAVVLGDPVCHPNDIPLLVHAFHQFCEEQKLSIIYLMASEPFAAWAMKNVCKALIKFGDELHVNPQLDPRSLQGTHASLVRRKVRHAIHEETFVNEYIKKDPALEQSMQEVAQSWLNNRKGPQVHISHVHLFEDVYGKRWFYAVQRSKMVGIVVLNCLESYQGWLINHVMVSPTAPHGTPELLVISALEALKNEGCTYATFGAVPEKHLSEIMGLGKIAAWTARLSYQAAYRLFHLEGLRMFWGKFQPKAKPSYLLFSQPKIGFQEIKALVKSMNVSYR